MNGVIVADKPGGWTSHDVVQKVKRTLGARKVGHLGTLDPAATGVLPLVIDGATRMARFMEGGVKVYLATMKFGESTDTYDSEGTVTGSAGVSGITPDDVRRALDSFRGRISQVPPMYSSVKQGGTPLYKLARRGVEVEREPKEVEVYSIDIESIELPQVTARISCSRGTYVRSIAHDAGVLLGCGAHLASLRRLKSGGFDMDDAVDPRSPKEDLTRALIPLERALMRFADSFREVEVPRPSALVIRDSTAPVRVRIKGFFSFLKAGEMVIFTHNQGPIALAEFLGPAPGGTLSSFKVWMKTGEHVACINA